MRRALALPVLAALLAAPLAAGDFPPIPAEAWAVKDAATEGKGVVVLETRLKITVRYIEVFQRIRVTSAAGREALWLPAFGAADENITGRTVQPDGKETPFTKKDFLSRKQLRNGGERERTVLVPPGVTQDCIVELQWRRGKNLGSGGNFSWGDQLLWTLSGDFPVRTATVELSKNLGWNSGLFPGRAARSGRSEDTTTRSFALLDIPASEDPPYSTVASRHSTVLVLFPMFEDLAFEVKQGPEAFWNAAGAKLYKHLFDTELRKGSAYKELSLALRRDLPAGASAQAAELLKRLNARIRNLEEPTFAEQGLKPREAPSFLELGDMAKAGAATGFGMTTLYMSLLRDAGIPFKVALAADRDIWNFSPRMTNLDQFNAVLVGVDAEGGTAWFAPGWRLAPPGILPAVFQGTQAMVYETAGWTGHAQSLPVQAMAANRRSYDYQLELGEEGDHFRMDCSVAGVQEEDERSRYFALDAAAQDKAYRERLEEERKGVQLEKASVLNGADLSKPIAFHAEGRIEREEGRRRTVDPFPLTPMAHWVPEHLEESRQEPIVLPCAGIHSAHASFRIPEGWAFGGAPAYEQSNSFGTVSWKVAKETRTDGEYCVVDLRVETARAAAAASDYAAFKDFLGWIREASGRTLVLEKSR